MLLAADLFEPNETLAAAADFGELRGPDVFEKTGLNLEPNADNTPSPDFFKFTTIAAGEPSDYVRLTHELFEGDLDLLLYNSAGELVGSSETPIDEEEISLEGLAAGTYTIEVVGFEGATNGYEITIQPPRELGPDLFEQSGPIDIAQENQTQFLDLAIWDGAGTGAPDEDLFMFSIPEGAEGFSTHYVEITFSQAVGDLELELLQAVDPQADPLEFTLLDSSETSTDNERISLENLGPGTYFAHVYGYSENGGVPATGRYNIDFNLPTNQTLSADDSEQNDSAATATLISDVGQLDFRTIHTATDVDFFKFTIPAQQTGSADHKIEIFFAHEWGDLNMELTDMSGQVFDTSLGVDDDESLSLDGLLPGDYVVRVFGVDGAMAAYDMRYNLPSMSGISADPFDTGGTNDSLSAATSIRQDLVDTELSIHNGSDQDFFRFTIPEGAVGTVDNFVRIDFDQDQGDLDLELKLGTGETVLDSTTTDDFEVIALQGIEPGEYFVRVSGVADQPGAGATANYQITFELPEVRSLLPDRNEPNDNSTTASSLRQSQTTDVVRASVLNFENLFGNLDNPFIDPDSLPPSGDRAFTIHNETDEDYYRITIPVGLTGTAEDYFQINFSHAEGDLNVQLRDAKGFDVLKSESVNDVERVSLQGLAAGEYTAIVYGVGGATAAYDMSVELPKLRQLQLQKPIGPDKLEPNNGFGAATKIAKDQVLSLTLISTPDATDFDIFEFTIPSGLSGTPQDFVEATFSLSQADVDLFLFAAGDSAPIRRAQTTAPVERLSLDGLTPGRYFVQANIANSNNASLEYDLQFSIPEAINVLPLDRFEFDRTGNPVPNDTIQTATFPRLDSSERSLFGNAKADASIHSAIDVDVYAVIVPNNYDGGEFRFSVALPSAQSTLALELLDNSGAVVASAVPASGSTSTYLNIDIGQLASEGKTTITGGETRYFRVRGINGSTGQYQLAVFAKQPSSPAVPDRLEPNDSLATATNLGTIEGRIQTINGTISKKGGALGFFGTGASELDHYRFRILSAGTAANNITMFFSNKAGDLDMALFDANGNELRGSKEGNRNFETISLDGLPAGEYTLEIEGTRRVHTGDYKLDINAPYRQSGYNIEVIFPDDTLSEEYRRAFRDAAARWSTIIVGDVPDGLIPQQIPGTNDWTFEFTGIPPVTVPNLAGRAVDDLLIVASGVGTDGNQGTNNLGSASAFALRSKQDDPNELPILGFMRFDLANLPDEQAKGTLDDLILHEMGHVISATFQWEAKKLTVNSKSCSAPAPRPVPVWKGENAVAEYRLLTENPNEASVPLESVGGCGSFGSHWAESIFDAELMTPTAENRPPMPLSRLTAAMMQDVGYQVDYAAADPYTLPSGENSRALSEGEDLPGEPAAGDVDYANFDPDNPPVPTIVSPLERLFPADTFETFVATDLRQNQSMTSLTTNAPGDEDLFRFTLTGRGTAEHFLTVSSELGRNLDLELRDSTNKVLSRGLTGGQTLSLAGWDPGVYTVSATTGDFNKYAIEFSGKFEAGDPTLAALDIDGDGSVNSLQDMRLIQLWKLDYTAEELEDGGFVDPSRGRTGSEVLAYLDSLADSLDIDGDGSINSLTDTRLVQLSKLDYSAEEFVDGNFIPSSALRTGDDVVSRLEGLFVQATAQSQAGALTAEGEGVMGPAQVLTLKTSGGGTSQTITVEYQTVDVNNAPTNLESQGITFSIFFDSTKLTPDTVASMVFPAPSNGTLRNGLTRIRTDSATNGGADGDASTDKRMDFQWIADTEAENFPKKATTDPAVLLTLAASISEATSINLTLGDGDSDFMQRSVGAPLALTTTVTASPQVSVAVAPSAVNEDGTDSLVYTFTRTGATTDALAVSYNVSGTATLGTDFTALSGTVTIPAGQATATVSVDPTDDTTVEPNETIILTVTDAAAYDVGTPAAATGMITNDDTAATTPSVSVAVAPATVNEDGTGSLVYTFTRTGATTDALAVSYTVTGTATSGTDYTALSGTVTIPAGQASTTVSVNPTDDTTVEQNETIILTVTDAAAYDVGTPAAATGTITNDDTAVATPTVSVAVAPSAVNEDGTGSLVYTFTRTGATTAALAVTYTVTGTATSGTDYTALSGTVTIPAGQASATVSVNPTDDTTVEPNETIILTVTDATAYDVGTPAAATGTITNDDTAVVTPTVSVAVAPASVNEDGTGSLVYTFTRTGATTAALAVTYTVTGTATSGTDYTALSGTVTIPAGQASATVSVNPTDDTTDEPNETIALTVTDAAAYDVGTPAVATGTITNDDTGPLVNFSTASQSVSEAGQSVTITVRLSRASDQEISIPFTVGGTASRNSDYTISASPLVFAAGQTEANFTVTPINDFTREGTEQVIVSLGQPSGATLGNLVSHNLSILDDESVESRIITPSLVARPHAIPANSLPTAVIFQAVTSSTITVFPIGSVSGAESIRILDGDLGDISFVSQGLTTANVETGKLYAILFGSQATEQLYTVRSSAGSSALAQAPTNIFEPTDVSADGQTTALDALQIINQMNIMSAAEGEQGSANAGYMDVNRDGRVSAQDALEVIYKLNRQSVLSLAHGEEMIPLVINAAQFETKEATSETLESVSPGTVKIVSLGGTAEQEPTKFTSIQDSTNASHQYQSDVDSVMSSVGDFIELID